MRIYLCFRRDEEGRERLFHAYDEFEMREANGGTPVSLQKALDAIAWRSKEMWGVVAIETGDPIVSSPPDLDRYPIGEQSMMACILAPKMSPVDFDKLLPAPT